MLYTIYVITYLLHKKYPHCVWYFILLTSHCLITIRRNLVATLTRQLFLRSEFGCSLCDLHFWIIRRSLVFYYAMPSTIQLCDRNSEQQSSWLPNLWAADFISTLVMGNSIPAIAGRISLKKSRSWPHRFFVARADSDKRNCYILT